MKANNSFAPGSRLLLIGLMVGILVMIATCDTSIRPGASNAVIQTSNSGVVSTALPTPVGTPQGIMAPTPGPRKPLGNASPEEVGQAAIAFTNEARRVITGTPQVALVRPVTISQVADLGLGWYGLGGTTEQPPLMLVLLKGDFSALNFPGGFQVEKPCLLIKGKPNSCPEPEHYHYIGYVYDLWAGMPTIFLQSKDGSIFRQALNDPTLPNDERPLSTSQYKPPSDSGAKLYHYGDTAIGEPSDGKQVHAANIGAISYIAYTGIDKHNDADNQPADPNRLYATVSWSWNSSTGGQDYVAANKQALPQVAVQGGQVEVSVVFKDYMTVEQFRAFVQRYGLKPGLSYLRAIDVKPVPVYAPYYTIKVNASNSDAIPQASLDSQLTPLTSDIQKQVALKGVYVTHAWMDAKQLQALAADPSVYYVDIAANMVRSDLAKAGVAGAAQAQVITYPQLIFNSLVEKPYQSK